MTHLSKGLIGFSGFVGQHLLEQTNFDRVYRSSNITQIRGQEFETLVCAGVPAVKWLANKEPEKDLETLELLANVLKTVNAKTFVLISTIDVYPNPSGHGDEDLDCADTPNHAYGANRCWFEKEMNNQFDHCVIIRLPALFGAHMKKNYIFDLLHDREEFIKQINLSSKFQWYDVSTLWDDIQKVLGADIRVPIGVVNLFTEPLGTRRMIEECFPQYFEKIPQLETPGLTYDLRTKHASLWGQPGKYIQSAERVLEKLRVFVKGYVHPIAVPRSLCFSNIAWKQEDDDVIHLLLELNNVKLLEVAPTRVFTTWDDVSDSAKLSAVKRFFEEKQVQITSLQAILFNKPNLELFASTEIRNELFDHTMKVIDLASQLRARVIVWGSPKQRQTRGRQYEECFQIACEWFKRVGEYSANKGVIIGIEANAREYGCDFCYTSPQAAALVRAVDSPGVKLHLDTANLHMAGDDIIACVKDNQDILCHVQVSEPNLGTFEAPIVNHDIMAKSLLDIGYNGAVSIEMRDFGNSVQAVAQALHFVKKVYKSVLA